MKNNLRLKFLLFLFVAGGFAQSQLTVYNHGQALVKEKFTRQYQNHRRNDNLGFSIKFLHFSAKVTPLFCRSEEGELTDLYLS